MGYFPRVYTSPTLVASPLQRIFGSGAWQGFLGIRARFDIKWESSSYRLPETSYITLQYTYRIPTRWYWVHLRIDCPPFKTPSLWPFDLSDRTSSLGVIWISSWFLFFSDSIFPDLIFWNRLSHSEAGSRNQSAQRKRGEVLMQWEAVRKLHLLPNLILSFPALLKFWGRNFC